MTVAPVAIIRYQYDNHLGSASLELDESADIISYEEYHPFGTTSYRSGRSETETSQKRYKYVGKERDEETGLYYYGFRYYAAWICRFVSVDPDAGKYVSLTPYCNAANNPISLIDAGGRGPIDFRFKEMLSEDSAYMTGFIAGIGDGLIETVDLAAGLAEKSAYYNIGTAPMMILKDIWNGKDAFSAYKEDYEMAQAFASLVSNKENLAQAWNSIKQELGDWWDEMTFEGTNAEAGYQHGKIVFEVIAEILTAGGSNAKHAAKILKQGGKELTEYMIKHNVPELLERKFTSRLIDTSDGVDWSKIQKVNNRFPINSKKYAGNVFKFDEGSLLAKKYKNGVKFNELGFPDFSPYKIDQVDIKKLKKSSSQDIDLANKMTGRAETPTGYVWHHVENSTELQLIPKDLHDAIRHTGGRATNAK